LFIEIVYRGVYEAAPGLEIDEMLFVISQLALSYCKVLILVVCCRQNEKSGQRAIQESLCWP